MIVVLWGVSGCGKTTVGSQLAVALGWTFFDADDFHPASNVRKMRQGVPLTDADRYPWLERLRALLVNTNSEGGNAVLACSALKQDYRDRLGFNESDVHGVHLAGSEALVAARLAQRNHEFMNPQLLASQYAALEPATDGLRLDIQRSPDALCAAIIKGLSLATDSL